LYPSAGFSAAFSFVSSTDDGIGVVVSDGFKTSVEGFDSSIMIGALMTFGSRISEAGNCSLIDGLAGKVGRTMGRGGCLPGEDGFWFIGPTITLGGVILGAGTGM